MRSFVRFVISGGKTLNWLFLEEKLKTYQWERSSVGTAGTCANHFSSGFILYPFQIKKKKEKIVTV